LQHARFPQSIPTVSSDLIYGKSIYDQHKEKLAAYCREWQLRVCLKKTTVNTESHANPEGRRAILKMILKNCYSDQYRNRLDELGELAREEDIGPVKDGPKNDFLEFLVSLGFVARRASLALLDNGGLGATWRNGEWRLGLEFPGGGKVDFVLLDRKNPPEGITGRKDIGELDIDYGEFELGNFLAQ